MCPWKPGAMRSAPKKPDLFISIHCDAADTSSAMGTTGFYYTPYSYGLADSIHDRLVSTWRDQIYKGTSVTVSKIDRGTRFYPFRVNRVQECHRCSLNMALSPTQTTAKHCKTAQSRICSRRLRSMELRIFSRQGDKKMRKKQGRW